MPPSTRPRAGLRAVFRPEVIGREPVAYN